MAEVKILIEGYAKAVKNGWVASSACCLIKSEGKKIITDPGCNRKKLIKALKNEKLKPSNVDYVFLSHGHIDHILLAGIFENAKLVTFDTNLLYDNDLMTEFDKHALGKDVEILKTPGHVSEHLSLIINTQKGKVTLAGDVFWWAKGEKQIVDINKRDNSQSMELDMKKLIASREKLLKNADFIIPGHGKMFKVDRKK